MKHLLLLTLLFACAQALALDASQNATFAGDVVAPRVHSGTATTGSIDSGTSETSIFTVSAGLTYIATASFYSGSGVSNHAYAQIFTNNSGSVTTVINISSTNLTFSHAGSGVIDLDSASGSACVAKVSWTRVY